MCESILHYTVAMNDKKNQSIIDCLIVGGGPAGITAGIYLARFRRKIKLIDNGGSRTLLIAKSHNYPGFPFGINGKKLLKNLRQQFNLYSDQFITGNVLNITKAKNLFVIKTDRERILSRTVLLATGATDIEPQLPNLTQSIKTGLVRHCPICDGYEVIGKRIAVIGFGKKGRDEALFLRNYSDSVTLITLGKKQRISPIESLEIAKAKIDIVEERLLEVSTINNQIVGIVTTSGRQYHFDTIYSALGCVVHCECIKELNAEKKQKFLRVNKHQETSISGLYAAGDVVSGLNQICVATSQAAIAATDIHNHLPKRW